MKNSKAFRDWQNDLSYLSYTYDINPAPEMEQYEDVFKQIVLAAEALPIEIKQQMDQHSGESLKTFLNNAADSLYELCRLLQLTLSLNLISIDEYHALMEGINEIGDIMNKFILQFNAENEACNRKPAPEDVAYWVLN